jgi:hypothetical protein
VGVNPAGGDNTAFLTDIKLNSGMPTSPTTPSLAVQALGDLASHGSVTYNDMLSMFNGIIGTLQTFHVTTVSQAQMQGLQTVAANTAYLGMTDAVGNLASKVINGDPANATYHYLDGAGNAQVSPMGNLQAGSSMGHLLHLVNKWFLGQDYPTAGSAYSPASGNVLFNAGGPSYTDVHQTRIGDCWLMSSLEEAALQTPAIIRSMFTEVAPNIWAVRFYVNGSPTYVTVDNQLPGGNSGPGDQPANGTFWAALAERAYAQLFGGDNYHNLDRNGTSHGPMSQITGRGYWQRSFISYHGEVYATTGSSISLSSILTASYAVYSESDLASRIYNAFTTGQLVTFCSIGGPRGNPSNSSVAPSHLYALLNVVQNGDAYSFTLGNPWGTGGGIDGDNGKFYPGSVTLSRDDLFSNFGYMAMTSGTSPASATSDSSAAANVGPAVTVPATSGTITNLALSLPKANLTSLGGARQGMTTPQDQSSRLTLVDEVMAGEHRLGLPSTTLQTDELAALLDLSSRLC